MDSQVPKSDKRLHQVREAHPEDLPGSIRRQKRGAGRGKNCQGLVKVRITVIV